MICDRVLAVALIILGLAQIAATPFFFPIIHEPAVWFGAGGFLLSLVGALNLLRIRYGAEARGVMWVSIGADFVIAAMWIAMAALMIYKFKRYPASFVALGIIASVPVVAVARQPSSRLRSSADEIGSNADAPVSTENEPEELQEIQR